MKRLALILALSLGSLPAHAGEKPAEVNRAAVEKRIAELTAERDRMVASYEGAIAGLRSLLAPTPEPPKPTPKPEPKPAPKAEPKK